MMNNRGHLPAGHQMHAGPDMGPGAGPPPPPPPPPGSGPRRGGRQHYNHHNVHLHMQQNHSYHHPQQHAAPPIYNQHIMTNNYPYYNAGYMSYPLNPYVRPAPTMQPSMPPFVPMQQTYPRGAQHSPIVSSAYHAPPMVVPAPVQVPAPMVVPPPHTPSSTHSFAAPPPAMTPPVQQLHEAVHAQVQPQARSHIPPQQPLVPQQLGETRVEAAPHPSPQPSPEGPVPAKAPPSVSDVSAPEPSPSASESLLAQVSVEVNPFVFPQPWLSVPDAPFPPCKFGRKRTRALGGEPNTSQFPLHQKDNNSPDDDQETKTTGSILRDVERPGSPVQLLNSTPKTDFTVTTHAVPAQVETPSTPQDHPSEDAASTPPTTPSSVQGPKATASAAATPVGAAKPAIRPAVPAVPVVPVIPALPKAVPKEVRPASSGANKPPSTQDGAASAAPAAAPATQPESAPTETTVATAEELSAEAPKPPPAPAKPKLWTGLFAKPGTSATGAASAVAGHMQTNGDAAAGSNGATEVVSGFAKTNSSSVAEALQGYRVGIADKLVFLEPRGLVNTGNMCYMNSVLQVLISCAPFYDFLDQVSKKLAHSFNSETPLLDAMIMFMREFKPIDSAASVEQLKRRLKIEDLERYGEAFTPVFVYEAIRKLPRFSTMIRGHQEDADEFLGFLLEGLHDECLHILRAAPHSTASTAPSSSLPSPSTASRHNGSDAGDEWLEVGPRQKSAVTRSSGHSHTPTPITKIFGGQQRSELRVQGSKNSVTLEPFIPLQLDIGAPEIRNIVDALKWHTRPEAIQGNFGSLHGNNARVIKQLFIESLPPVLILHLKRYELDAGGGTKKIWKKVGYPLELEIPREVLSPQKRNSILNENAGLPKYRLSAVVYHHGNNASGGHYTVDVRRQDGQEWIRLDDTVIRRVRAEDVAEGGAEEKPSKPDGRRDGAAATSSNRYGPVGGEETADDEGGWKQATSGGKKWSSVANGSSPAANNAPKAKQHKDSIMDNKVAYLLFYQRI